MRKAIPFALTLVLLAAACSGGDGDETTTTVAPTTTGAPTTSSTTTSSSTTTTSTTTTTTTTTVPVEDTWPLTGEPGYVDKAPIVFVKIDNTSRGRPQTGLEKADLVFEIIVEGGVSRLLAGFQSEIPEVVGPVRSVRETDARLLFPFAPYFANSGGQSFVRDMVNVPVSRDISHPNLGNRAYYRARNRPSVYDLMLEPLEAIARRGQLGRGNRVRLLYGEAPPGGQPATEVSLSMSNPQVSNWAWSDEDGLYLRSNSGNPHLAESGDQIAASNVLALEVEQILLNRTDSAGSRVPDYRIVGSGPMVLFRDGQAFVGTWDRVNFQESWFTFLGADGEEIPFAVGSTWIEIVPAGRSILYQ